MSGPCLDKSSLPLAHVVFIVKRVHTSVSNPKKYAQQVCSNHNYVSCAGKSRCGKHESARQRHARTCFINDGFDHSVLRLLLLTLPMTRRAETPRQPLLCLPLPPLILRTFPQPPSHFRCLRPKLVPFRPFLCLSRSLTLGLPESTLSVLFTINCLSRMTPWTLQPRLGLYKSCTKRKDKAMHPNHHGHGGNGGGRNKLSWSGSALREHRWKI